MKKLELFGELVVVIVDVDVVVYVSVVAIVVVSDAIAVTRSLFDNLQFNAVFALHLFEFFG